VRASRDRHGKRERATGTNGTTGTVRRTPNPGRARATGDANRNRTGAGTDDRTAEEWRAFHGFIIAKNTIIVKRFLSIKTLVDAYIGRLRGKTHPGNPNAFDLKKHFRIGVKRSPPAALEIGDGTM
jgi:hypothetical protein